MNEKTRRDAGILDKGVLNTEDICAMAWQQRNEKATKSRPSGQIQIHVLERKILITPNFKHKTRAPTRQFNIWPTKTEEVRLRSENNIIASYLIPMQYPTYET
jgi:hypothetical protein